MKYPYVAMPLKIGSGSIAAGTASCTPSWNVSRKSQPATHSRYWDIRAGLMVRDGEQIARPTLKEECRGCVVVQRVIRHGLILQDPRAQTIISANEAEHLASGGVAEVV